MFQQEILTSEQRTDADYDEVLQLCNSAYEEDVGAYLAAFADGTHVLGKVDGTIVSHAMWVTRWLQVGDGPFLKTAYVELVATGIAHRNRGYASAVMKRLVTEIRNHEIENYEIGGLCPSSEQYYTRLGWESWRGPLLIRKDGELLPTPPDEDGEAECLMIYRLPQTPKLSLDALVSIEWREGEVW